MPKRMHICRKLLFLLKILNDMEIYDLHNDNTVNVIRSTVNVFSKSHIKCLEER